MTAGPRDLEVCLPDRPGALADLGQALGAAGVSLEGGGVFARAGRAVAHYLVDDGPPRWRPSPPRAWAPPSSATSS
ncbi:ACT domain-containing protein [Streptomyces buecherae]|uniref:ACT domain-containing protein n=1 Tax=Streptomyces buecherae TaxID=2763006 RepID=UPI0018D92870|nr:ACT domain-containing protein [Streptomyces buecherae]